MSTINGINPGRLNKRVTIKRYIEEENDLGSLETKLKPIKTVWAEIRPVRGQESLEYYKINNQETYKITMRYTDVTEKDVIEYDGKQYQIMSIADPLLDHYYLEIMAFVNKDHEVRKAVEDE